MLRRTQSKHVPHFLGSVYNKIFLKTGLIPDQAVRDICSRLSATATWGVFGVMALGTAGIDTSPLLTGLGVGGAALGFAAKDIGANFMAGVLLALNRNRKFAHGDRLRVGVGSNAVEGVVTGWDLRHLLLRNDKEEQVLIPNSMVFSSVITVEIVRDKKQVLSEKSTEKKPTEEVAKNTPKT